MPTSTQDNADNNTTEDETTYILDRFTDENGKVIEVRMPTSEWADYAKEHGL